jgi:hypothetical protein
MFREWMRLEEYRFMMLSSSRPPLADTTDGRLRRLGNQNIIKCQAGKLVVPFQEGKRSLRLRRGRDCMTIEESVLMERQQDDPQVDGFQDL